MSERHDNPPPIPNRRGFSYWVDAIGMGMLAAFLAIVISIPVGVAGARMTEGSREASVLFGICYNGFWVAIAILFFRGLRVFFRPPQS